MCSEVLSILSMLSLYIYMSSFLNQVVGPVVSYQRKNEERGGGGMGGNGRKKIWWWWWREGRRRTVQEAYFMTFFSCFCFFTFVLDIPDYFLVFVKQSTIKIRSKVRKKKQKQKNKKTLDFDHLWDSQMTFLELFFSFWFFFCIWSVFWLVGWFIMHFEGILNIVRSEIWSNDMKKKKKKMFWISPLYG